MQVIDLDVVVIGSGPGGQKSAIQAAKLGKKVAIVEKDIIPGGACLNSGTIPSKTLRSSILDMTNFYEKSFYGKDYKLRDVSINDLNYRLLKVVEKEESIIRRQFKRNNITVFTGNAEFKDKKTIEVKNVSGKTDFLIQAKVIILATGSKPRNPMDVPFDDRFILDSTRLLSIDKVPDTMLVLGGGIIGSEYASFFATLGTKVTVLDKKDHMLPRIDREIAIHLETALKESGLMFCGKKETTKIYHRDNQAFVECLDGSKFSADVLLFALGRIANLDSLKIENAGIALTESGHVKVNDLFQTNVSHIFAVGDLIGPPSLASTSMEQGRLSVLHAFGKKTKAFPDIFPIGVFTIPEISSCGRTEKELEEKGFNYEVGRAYYYEIACSHIQGSSDVGMFKILFHKETLEILGVHIIGRGATEVIHIGQIAMHYHAKIDFFIDQIFNYPTFAEGFRIAALNGYNKIK